ncbi:hypothetical protein KAU55_00840 [Candidatus Bathyarchaeota archaeon]|nr:hypothetical protein [Candidatus Bathyarchaeota archaeon]
MTNEKILEVEDLLKSLSDEMLKLKSASKHYEETRENLQNMCESIDKISVTHQKLTSNMSQLLAEMEKNARYQSKAMRLMKPLILLGMFMEVVVIILILLL